ncbi:MAG: hypothetical protein FWF69_04735 [Firmicutes bacterium]|nr:hypothetical protein [Bacillota bacterium]
MLKLMLPEFDLPKEEIDVTPHESRDNAYSFGGHDLALIGIPIYGARVPSMAEKRIKQLKGKNTPAILVVTYGNVHYFDALFEFQQLAAANGFIPIAAAAIVSAHNVVNGIAQGRPDSRDAAKISDFIKQVKEKISCAVAFEAMPIKGKMPSRPRDMLPIKPHGNKKCTGCGVCGKLCPAQAIADPRRTAGSSCIRCMRCIRYCPQKARTYGKAKGVMAKAFLTIASRGEKQPEFFL